MKRVVRIHVIIGCISIVTGVLPLVAADSLDVVINEIAWMGTEASTYDEWIELFNNTDADIDLTDWILEAQDGAPAIVLSGTIPAGGYFLMERSDDNTVSDIAADLVYSGTLGNDGECLALKDSTGKKIDEIDCSGGWFFGSNDPKVTMERKNPGMAGSDSTFWAANDTLTVNGLDADGTPLKGTPKAQNSVYEVMTSVSGGPVLPETCRLYDNFPNPFNPGTAIRFCIAGEKPFEHISLKVYDCLGREVIVLMDDWVENGEQIVEWNGSDFSGVQTASGIYFYRLVAGNSLVQTKRMVKLQ